MRDNFAIFIITHGRADRVYTYKTLQKTDYSGKVYFIVDDEDEELEKYQKNFGKDNVIIFSKDDIAKRFDVMDNFKDKRAIVYARNACYEIARKLGIRYFLELDDDYTGFYTRYVDKGIFKAKQIFKVEESFENMLRLLDSHEKLMTVAFAQAGDFIGGKDNGFEGNILRRRKAMNTFFCDVDKQFPFVGRINEDVNAYLLTARKGQFFITVPELMIVQKQTQTNKGGLTDTYKKLGTYVKSFYSVMINPSAVRVALMGGKNKRLHHRLNGKAVYPMITRDKYARRNTA